MGNDYYSSPQNRSSTSQKRSNVSGATTTRVITLILWVMIGFAFGQAAVRTIPYFVDDPTIKSLITAALYTLFIMALPAWFYGRDVAVKGGFRSTVAYLGLRKPRIPQNRSRRAISLLLLIIAIVGLLLIVNCLETLSQYIIENMQGKAGELLRVITNRENATMELLLGDNIPILLRIVVVAVLPAFAEELFMRGALQPLFIDIFKRQHAGIIVTALLFALLHGSAQHFLGILAFALFFGYLAHYCRSLWPGIVLHLLNNAATIFLYQQTQSI